MAAANAVGGKMPNLLLENPQNLAALKNVKFISCQYRSEQKSWRDGVLFEEWVQKILHPKEEVLH